MNIREIANIANVSVASVSRALQEPASKKVSAELREKIRQICDEHHYYPNKHTVRMLSKRADSIAMLFPEGYSYEGHIGKQVDDNLSAVAAGAGDEFARDLIYMTMASTTEKFIKSREHLKFIRSKMVDGVIIWGWTSSEVYINELIKENIPLVLIQCATDEFPVSYVVSQDFEGMKMIIDHVVAYGHRNIAIAAPSLTASAGCERYRGILAGLKEHGIEPVWISSQRGFGIKTGYQACKEIMQNKPETTCIIGSNDLSALGIIKAAREMNINVPEQLSVTGADCMNFYGMLSLTTFITPSYEMGIQGAKTMKKLMENPEAGPIRIKLPVQFITGETTKEINGVSNASL